MRVPRLSLVLPLRNAQDQISYQSERLLEALTDLVGGDVELVLVDDGSVDGTPEALDELRHRFPQIQSVRHPRELGFEAAGQSGLKRARSELVLVAEDDGPIHLADVQRLLMIGKDSTVVAARAKTEPKPLSGPLLRRLRAWGAAVTQTGSALRNHQQSPSPRGLQLVRKPHMDYLSSPAGLDAKLHSESLTATSVW